MRGANAARTGRARRLRQASTDAERKLWYRLRSHSIDGLKFVRQEPIGPYVADFVCRERRLIMKSTVVSMPKASAISFVTNGSLNIGTRNNDVLTNIDGVLEAIVLALNDDDRS